MYDHKADSTVFTYNKAEQTYAVAVNALYTVSNDKRTNAGSQTVTVALIDELNYEWADNTTADVEFTFTINKAVYGMSNVTFADKSIKADGNAQNIVIGGTLPAGVTVRYEGNGKTEPGVYTVTAIFTGDAAWVKNTKRTLDFSRNIECFFVMALYLLHYCCTCESYNMRKVKLYRK